MLKSIGTELKVGIFAIVALTTLGYMFFVLQPDMFQSKEYATYYTVLNNAAGIVSKSQVKTAGVTIGKVTAIDLDRDSFTGRVTMQLDKKVDNLPTDSTASILTAGLLGEKYIGVSVGGETALLKDGSTIHDTQSSLVLEDLIGKFLLNTVNKDAK